MKDELVRNIFFVAGNIADKKELKKRKIDTIVNAAKPTLMGSNQGVDGAIHQAIDRILGRKGGFKDKICEELKMGKGRNIIRCQRGEAVLTSGYGLCKYVIHVVGAKYDEGQSRFRGCSSSTVHTLESCYYDIVERIKEHPDIKNIAIPIISSGEYQVPFRTAAEIAVASVYNAIVEWKSQDPEIFEMSGLKRIYFFVYDEIQCRMAKVLEEGNAILQEYKPVMAEGKKVVFQSSVTAHFRYWKEIADYDEARGYFSAAKGIRELMMFIRVLFLPPMCLKDLCGGKNWERRRRFVERFAMFKACLPMFFCLLVSLGVTARYPVIENWVLPAFLIYNMSDTVTYLLSLIILTDIQRPSANIIRSMIMLFVNYIEVSLGMSYLYFVWYEKKILLREAVAFGLLGMRAEVELTKIWDYVFLFAEAGIRFFFITLVFGYFANHMHQRKFRS